MLLESAKALCPHYKKISVPVSIIAGSQDQIVDTDAHSARLHEELAFSTLQRVPACGHMVHHAASEDVLAAIAALARLQGIKAIARAMASPSPRRNWLHIGESLVAA